MTIILIVILSFVVAKLIGLAIIFVINLIYLRKAKDKNSDANLYCVRKDTCLWWYSNDTSWCIIPTIGINIDSNFSITFQWLKCTYIQTWSAVTYEEENAKLQ